MPGDRRQILSLNFLCAAKHINPHGLTKAALYARVLWHPDPCFDSAYRIYRLGQENSYQNENLRAAIGYL
jgi:hypothetical protein